jgi:hypothetical protein
MYNVIYALTLFTAALAGWGCSLFWVTGAKYVNDCANDKNKGLFNSMLFVANKGSLISGNLMVAYVVPNASETMLYMIMTGLTALCCFYFALV